jgi:hypothetical protein
MEVTKKQLVDMLARLGYEIEEASSFNYFNTLNGAPYAARACYVIESDTGLGFANINARRDARFTALQEMRRNNEFWIKGRLYEL